MIVQIRNKKCVQTEIIEFDGMVQEVIISTCAHNMSVCNCCVASGDSNLHNNYTPILPNLKGD